MNICWLDHFYALLCTQLRERASSHLSGSSFWFHQCGHAKQRLPLHCSISTSHKLFHFKSQRQLSLWAMRVIKAQTLCLTALLQPLSSRLVLTNSIASQIIHTGYDNTNYIQYLHGLSCWLWQETMLCHSPNDIDIIWTFNSF